MRVRVCVYGDHHEQLHEGIIEVSPYLARIATTPLDYPTPDAGTAALFCTTEVERLRVSRHPDLLAKAIADELVSWFAQQDTEMGYPKPE